MGSFIHGQARRDFSESEHCIKKSIQPNKIQETKNKIFKATKTDATNNMRKSDLSETYTETKPHFTVEEN